MGILDYFNTPGGYDPNQQTTSKGLFDNAPNVFLTPNLNKAGILDEKTQKALQSQATKTGGVLSLVDFITRPRTMGANSVLPYLGEAYKTGFTGAQDVYNTGLNQQLKKIALGQTDSPFAKINTGDIDWNKTTSADVENFKKTQNPSYLKFKQETPFKETPAWLGKIEEASFDKILSTQNLIEDTSMYIDKFARDEIPTGLYETATAKGAGVLGMESDATVALKDFERFKRQLVNETLRLNKGVQTEGDAQRALEEFQSAKTNADHIAAMTRLRQINARAQKNEMEKLKLQRQGAGVSATGLPTLNQYRPMQLPDSNQAIEIINSFPSEGLSDKNYPAFVLPDDEGIADAVVERLPKGAYFVGNDGLIYQKK